MSESKADLILHPIRMRIIQSLIGGARRTTLQLSEIMPDIPQATMYRHLNKLLTAKIIEVVEEQKVRGTLMKVYILTENGGDIPIEDLNNMTSEEHMDLFMKFIASLIGDYGRYIQQEHYDLEQDGLSLRQLELNLSDKEYIELLHGMRAQMMQHIGNELNGERKRRNIVTISIPEPKRS
ncbi:helix-turn-helix domain-containing protein [Paenibacillus macquariensis]|uniref:Helix-turn-helix domain-containing protein n=1 Tax=Paenibacillus macquariensis TaxID=948756 RepID=A0ABY1KAF7_9BACL|nr:helix-turn-helix domain-containing protein [Paenibacillus macquariensis]MEC0093688.1 helix-turn-helix domain-containing protein [Paenibacillus macquariensis]SIR50866.1 Helix-turn-helix domain-containing protein [Paenibacillus macquariensis]